ncbi:MAG: hypothetical protein K6F72_00160 [Bacteroidales bacterium]|nr:hypothetical protein [Bacteroidales bacterium]
MQGYEIKFNIYAESAEEATVARNAIVGFIDTLAKQGRAVTGRKIATAAAQWDKNPFVRNKIVEYFS